VHFVENNGITLVLIFPPYVNGEIDEGQRKIAVDYYSKLSQTNKNIYFLNYIQDTQLSNNPNYGWDKNHLKIKGANILSKENGLELNQILNANI
jgi:hypothetical protein